jgi:chromosome condensin MukBEF ATPase and DNA-binding subunit MukB
MLTCCTHHLHVCIHCLNAFRSQASKNEQERLEQRRRELADAIQEFDAKEVPLRQQLQEAENSLKRYITL